MPVVDPLYWFLPSSDTPRSPAFTRGNQVHAFVDGMGYMADLHREIGACDSTLLIAGWRMSNEQLLNPMLADGGVTGESLIGALTAAIKRGCSAKALLFNVPGTSAPGPFRLWHAQDNFDFAHAVADAGGEVLLDSRLAPVPASAHHQKFVLLASRDSSRNVAYLGGIDVCFDRWDRPAHDAAPERQRDVVKAGAIETHTPSQPGWHDVQVRLQGPALVQIWRAFQQRWNDPRPANHGLHLAKFRKGSPLVGAPECPAAGQQAVQVNLTLPPGVFPEAGGPGELTVARAHERAIERARHYVYVEDQYVWPCSLVEKLEAALARGVHVAMVVARDYDAPGLAPIARRLRHQVFARLQKAGGDRFRMVHIEREDGQQIYVHSKVLIVDDCYASVGSANFNARSLTNDTEMQIGVVDEDLIETPFGGKPELVCRFAHELRCALWAEHLEQPTDAVRDPMDALARLWPQVPSTPGRRARQHDASLGPLSLDPIAEYVTTLITERMAHAPLLAAIPLPAGTNERGPIKLAVDAALRGPRAALILKLVEELLNPDIAPAVADITGRIASAVGLRTSANAADDKLGAQIITQLRRRRLPRMVDWLDPSLLVKIGIRDLISGTIGQYADQRLMQAASDNAISEDDLVARYDYSRPDAPDPKRRVATDEEGRVWVDYAADLGDGFEATYAVAYLMAKERLEVECAGPEQSVRLPAGAVLVLGGDQAYPQATQQEYQRRLVDPYNWACPTETPDRKLFAIPGNHDWYDGLNAFTSLFTSARDRISGGIGKQLGAWRCHQHRSYWAIKLPHDWWIWGPDIQLAGNLDDPQRDYFDIVSDYTKAGDKIIICLAEPSWHHENYDNLHEISMLARKKGAIICAVLAGDWHHYSRYTNDKLGVQFITCGGGGAFAHATHQLKNKLDLQWADRTGLSHRVAEPEDTLEFNRMEQGIVNEGEAVDYSIKDYSLSAEGGSQTMATSPGRRRPFGGSLSKKAYDLVDYVCHTPRIYPSKTKSRLLALKNLVLPFRNVSFAALVGVIYFLYAWVFQASAPELDLKSMVPAGKLTPQEAAAYIERLFWTVIGAERVLAAVRASPVFFFILIGLWAGLIYYVDLGKGFFASIGKLVIGTAHFAAHLAALLIINTLAFLPSIFVAVPVLWTVEHIPFLSASTKVLEEVAFLCSFALTAIVLGGLVGAFIMGIYWTVTSTLFNMHCGDAFGALGIRNYKHFLRMCFEADRVTIYPIGVDKVPGRRGWRAATGEDRAVNPALIVPKTPLKPFLIEEPIVINARKMGAQA